MHGSIQALERWSHNGTEVLIITSSAPSTMDANCAWLDKHLRCAHTLNPIPYRIIQVDYAEGKNKVCLEEGVTHYVDDRYKTCINLAKDLEQVYLYNAPYNEGRPVPDNVQRVNTLTGVINHIMR
jgi:uncharacterized HAD superfamily protein